MSRVFTFGPFRLDADQRLLWRDGEPTAVTPRAVELLGALVERAGEVVAKRELLERVWPDTFVEEANLSVNVSALRKALGLQENGKPYIETVARRGYRFLAESARSSPGAPRSLAVLPFLPLDPAAGDEALGLGMADALITRLCRVGRLPVRATSAVARYQDVARDLGRIARALDVDAVVDGKIQRSGERLRVTLQLVSRNDAAPLWAGTFDEAPASLFDLQDRVAAELVSALSLELTSGERRLLAKRPTESLAAYEAHARGRYFWSRFTGPWLTRAVQCFHEALEADAAYALPHAGLADASVILGFTGALPPRDAWPLAREQATRALERDDSLAEAHVTLAFVDLFEDWNWTAAGKRLERALTLAPASAAVQQWYAVYLDLTGRLPEALAAIRTALSLDPLSLVANALLGMQFYLAGRNEEALLQGRRTVELDPFAFVGHWSLGLACLESGLHAEALAAHRKALEVSEGSPMMAAVLARSLAVVGDVEAARATLAEAGEGASPYPRATVYAALGETDRALDLLEGAREARDPWLVWLAVDPMLEPLRRDPRFGALLRQIGPPGLVVGPGTPGSSGPS